MSLSRFTILTVAGLSLMGWSYAQQAAKEEATWAPKREPAQYPVGTKPHTKLVEVLAKHKGQNDWREQVVADDHFNADYVSLGAGGKVIPRFHPDTRAWWIVMDGEMKFTIEGHGSFTARKGSMVQVPMQTIYSMETVGEKPSLRFEVTPAKAHTLYPKSEKPPQMPGVSWIPVVLGRTPQPYGYENKPHLNLYDLAKDPNYKGSRFVHDDRGVSNIIYGTEKGMAPINPNDKGHFHEECAEFWLIMMGKIRYPIEKVGTIIADEGDVVYVPPSTFHAPRFYGEGMSCRLAINGYPNIAHLREAH